jgi:hypothetical protein
MLASELEGILNAHAFLRVERPPLLWEPDVDLADGSSVTALYPRRAAKKSDR